MRVTNRPMPAPQVSVRTCKQMWETRNKCTAERKRVSDCTTQRHVSILPCPRTPTTVVLLDGFDPSHLRPNPFTPMPVAAMVIAATSLFKLLHCREDPVKLHTHPKNEEGRKHKNKNTNRGNGKHGGLEWLRGRARTKISTVIVTRTTTWTRCPRRLPPLPQGRERQSAGGHWSQQKSSSSSQSF
jgi:hypothetical protein